MKLRRPECDEQPSKPRSEYNVRNQFTMEFAFKCEPRYERIIGPMGSVVRSNRSRAWRSSGCVGTRRPPRFFAILSLTFIVPDTRPRGSRTIAQSSPAISHARNPALTDRSIITRSRSGVDECEIRRSMRLSIAGVTTLACFPGIGLLVLWGGAKIADPARADLHPRENFKIFGRHLLWHVTSFDVRRRRTFVTDGYEASHFPFEGLNIIEWRQSGIFLQT